MAKRKPTSVKASRRWDKIGPNGRRRVLVMRETPKRGQAIVERVAADAIRTGGTGVSAAPGRVTGFSVSL